MTRLKKYRLAFWIAVLATVGAGVFLLATVVAPDGCLDQGGSFDYENWECSDDIHANVVWPARLVFALALFFGLVLTLIASRRRVRNAQQRHAGDAQDARA